jgi:cytochrome P450
MADPYPDYDRLRESTPVHWSAQENAWVLSRYGDVAMVLSDPTFVVVELAEVVDGVNRLANRNVDDLRAILSTVLFLRDPTAHAVARRYLVAVLGASSVATYASIIEDVVDSLLRTNEQPFDAVTRYADLIPPLFMGRLLGLPADAVASVVKTVADVTMVMDRGRSLRFYARANDSVAAGLAVLSAEVAERRRERRTDGLSRMIDLSDAEFHLADREIATQALFLLIAGIETTSALIGSAIKAVLETPGAVQRLADDPGCTDAAIEEVIRYESPAQQTTRIASRETNIGGHEVRAGDHVILLLGAAHRDPEAYDRPSDFDIGRSGPAHLGFGKGLHHCIGPRVARLEARIALTKLLARGPEPVPDFRCTWWPHRTLRRLKSFPVVLTV